MNKSFYNRNFVLKISKLCLKITQFVVVIVFHTSGNFVLTINFDLSTLPSQSTVSCTRNCVWEREREVIFYFYSDETFLIEMMKWSLMRSLTKISIFHSRIIQCETVTEEKRHKQLSFIVTFFLFRVCCFFCGDCDLYL